VLKMNDRSIRDDRRRLPISSIAAGSTALVAPFAGAASAATDAGTGAGTAVPAKDVPAQPLIAEAGTDYSALTALGMAYGLSGRSASPGAPTAATVGGSTSWSADAALERDWNALIYDGPGQGAMLFERASPRRGSVSPPNFARSGSALNR
jgi:hypothetical protein